MSKEKISVWDAKTWQTYKRLLGYTKRFRAAGLIAVLGMIIDPACLSLFRIADNGKLDFVRKYNADVRDQQMYWMGMV